MSILVNKDSKILVQGFTGSEGTFHSEQMLKYGSNIVPWNGDNHPPKNMILHKILINIKFMYSAKKNMANAIPEYSTWKPATISDSPSDTSNGALFVSATPAIKYIKNNGNKGSQYQFNRLPDWA